VRTGGRCGVTPASTVAGGRYDLRHPAVIVVSQSGETSDTLAALREVRQRGDKTLAITNVPESTMAEEAGVSMPRWTRAWKRRFRPPRASHASWPCSFCWAL